MPEYFPLLDTVIEEGDLATTVIFTALRDNPLAIAQGASGAPQHQTAAFDSNVVDAAAIGAGAVTTAELAATSVTEAKLSSVTPPVDQAALDTDTNNGTTGDAFLGTSGDDPTGTGEYAFYPQVKWGTFGGDVHIAYAAVNTSFLTNIGYDANTGGRWLQRFIQASPPYDLGDGDVPLFVYLLLKGPEIIAVTASAEPPWSYLKTNIAPDFEFEGKQYRLSRDLPMSLSAAAKTPETLAQYLDARSSIPWYPVEITRAFKNTDMPLRPHPFGKVPEGLTVAMLDPVSSIVADLATLAAAGEDVGALIRDGLIVLGPEIERHAPPGVKVITAEWSE